MNYKIEIGLRDCQYPQRYEGETDAEYGDDIQWWETEGKYSAFWRLHTTDGDGITGHHFAMQSGIFRKSNSGAKELKDMVEKLAIPLSLRQAQKKNELLSLQE